MKTLARTALFTLMVTCSLAASRPGAAQAAPAKPSPQESLVELLPARARVAAIVRKNSLAPLRDLLFSDVEMMRELAPYLERSLGIDLTRLEGVAVFTMDASQPEPKLGAILRIPSAGSALKLKAAGDAGGTPLYRLERDVMCARLKSGLVIGHEAEVRAVVAVERGREAALPRDAGLGRLLVTDSNDVDLVIAVGPGALPQAAAMGVDDAFLSFRHEGLLELVLHGDPNRLSGLRAMALGAIQAGVATLAAEKDKAIATNEPLKGTAAIMLYHQMRKLAADLEPKQSGNALSVRYQLPDTTALGKPMGLTGMAGIMAAIAIPNFIKFQQRAKSTEARTTVRSLTTAVMSWASEPGHKPQALRSTDWAPSARCCGLEKGQCIPDQTTFSGPTWKTLGVSLTDPMRYQYRVLVEPKAKGKPARIVVEARGDLDCDSEMSSYRQAISFGPEGPTMGELEIQNDTE